MGWSFGFSHLETRGILPFNNAHRNTALTGTVRVAPDEATFLRERGIDHRAFDETLGLSLVLTSIEARFKAPGKLGDILAVSADLLEIKGARAVFTQEIRRDSSGGELLVEGRAEVVCVDSANGRAKRWPAEFVKELTR